MRKTLVAYLCTNGIPTTIVVLYKMENGAISIFER